jgi:hypothetical protein
MAAPGSDTAQSGSGSSGGGGNITPMVPGAGAGPLTPVSGAENMGGTTGGGVAQALKDKARSTAASQGARPQPPPDEGDTGQ